MYSDLIRKLFKTHSTQDDFIYQTPKSLVSEFFRFANFGIQIVTVFKNSMQG